MYLQVCDCGLGLQPRLYTGPVCDNVPLMLFMR